MYRQVIFVLMVLFSCAVYAHEMTPTYLKLVPSHMEGVYKTSVRVFNRRNDVEYYEIGVFDKDFNSVPFATSYKIVKVNYLSKVNVDVYIRKDDVGNVVYVCSQSKLRKDQSVRTAIASRICSKVK